MTSKICAALASLCLLASPALALPPQGIPALGPETVSETNSEGNTALHLAAAEGLTRWVRLLLESGAKPDLLNHEGLSPMHLAARNGRSELLSLMLAKLPAAVNLLSSRGQTPLYLAVMHRQAEAAGVLLAAGARADIADEAGMPPVLLAVIQADQHMISLLETSRPGLLEGLKTPLSDGRSWLHVLACQPDQAGALELLMAQGLDPVLPDPASGKTPFVMALEAGELGNAEALLEKSPKLPAALEAKAWQALDPLISAQHLKADDQRAALTQLLTRFSPRLKHLDADGRSLLHRRVLEGDQLAVSFLLKQKFADSLQTESLIEQRTSKGLTPLMLAVALKQAEPELVSILLAAGAKVKEADPEGNTVLHLAVLNKQPQTVSLLLPYYGALPVNRQGKTPLDLAQQLRQAELVELLRPLYIKTLY